MELFMARRMIVMILVVGLVFGGIFGFQIFKGVMIQRFFATRVEPPQTVSTYTAAMQTWRPAIEVVGGLRAEFGTDIAPEVGGLVISVPFRSGEDVEKGAVLLRLRSDDDVARLNSLKANAELARLTAMRQRKLLTSGTVAQAGVDQADAALRSAEAQLVEQQALIDKKTIHAPFSGRIGIREVDVGQVITAGTKAATLQALDRLYFDFTIPQRLIGQIAVGQALDVTTDAFPNERLVGHIAAIDSKVDSETRNVSVRAELKNPDRKWLPGMYAKGSLAVGEPQNLITVPQTAVTFNTFGDTIFVVDANPAGGSIAHQKFVKTGERRGDQVSVIDGLAVGEQIVVAGALKLHNNSPVTINNAIPVSNDPAPVVRDQ
jgi:membrane fusion protein (multidrug efflux system)